MKLASLKTLSFFIEKEVMTNPNGIKKKPFDAFRYEVRH